MVCYIIFCPRIKIRKMLGDLCLDSLKILKILEDTQGVVQVMSQLCRCCWRRWTPILCRTKWGKVYKDRHLISLFPPTPPRQLSITQETHLQWVKRYEVGYLPPAHHPVLIWICPIQLLLANHLNVSEQIQCVHLWAYVCQLIHHPPICGGGRSAWGEQCQQWSRQTVQDLTTCVITGVWGDLEWSCQRLQHLICSSNRNNPIGCLSPN